MKNKNSYISFNSTGPMDTEFDRVDTKLHQIWHMDTKLHNQVTLGKKFISFIHFF